MSLKYLYQLADFGKFGRVQQIYQPHGILWVDGINVGDPIRVESTHMKRIAKQDYRSDNIVYPTNPLNYRLASYAFGR